ncbi:PREDICTED: C5a anaphylatoxin chemotactic receptor 1-like [Chaetura pelagica]|uniref:C5a anaphylatoxin chemotactic receptor 1-like n=1 Tax=Chaetura pelagica TaxID=8897 RepID=UPI000523E049|nr:PREDICTED: C5a anaphylatoxin chemotactic receptor 1-like [Chaetura pelagica]
MGDFLSQVDGFLVKKEWEERRRQNIEKMNEEMEKIAEYERNQRDGLQEKNPVRNFLDDPRRSGPFQDSDRREGSRRHVRNWGGADFDKVKAGMEKEKTWQGPGRRSSPKSGVPLDMTLSMTGRERAEYVRWKKEREQIDRERLARHRNPAGTWRREWDAQKSDTMFKEDPGLEVVGEEEPKRPHPKPPTFGEFLVPPRGQRRRKSRGRGLTPPELTDPPGGAQNPLDSPPLENLQLKEEEPLEEQEEAATENGTQGPFPDTTPGTVEITDFQRIKPGAARSAPGTSPGLENNPGWQRMDYYDSFPNYTFNSTWDYESFDLGGYEVSLSQRVVLTLYALIFLLGVLGNGAVIWVTAFELRRTVNGVWFLNLSLADLLCCLALPFLAIPLLHDHHWPLGGFACKLIPSLTVLNMFTSVLLLTLISADRCALVTRPVWCQNHRTLALARVACGAAWLLATLLTLPSFIFRTIRADEFSDKTTCVLSYTLVGSRQRLTEVVISTTRFLCGFLVPFVVITGCYGLLLARVYSKGLARSQKAIKLILVIITSFFICWLPYHVVGLILASTHPQSGLYKGALEVDPIVAGVAYVNSCINPIIYVVMGQDFKGKVQRSWRTILRRVLSDDPPTSTGGDTRMKTKSTIDDQTVSTIA